MEVASIAAILSTWVMVSVVGSLIVARFIHGGARAEEYAPPAGGSPTLLRHDPYAEASGLIKAG